MNINKYEKLFTPIKLGNLVAKNRIFSAPTSLNWNAIDGNLTPETIAYFELKAKGGAAVVTYGESIVHEATGKSHDRQICLDNPNCLVSLSQLARAIKRHGAIPSAELSHGGKWGGLSSIAGELAKEGKVAYGASPEILPEGEVFEMPRELIYEIADAFGKGAAVLKRAGFEMCMLHAGHGWLFGQFLSKKSNHRTDEFGGSIENRARFLIMALDSIRAAVGPGFPIEVRMSGDEYIDGGITLEEATQIAKLIEDKCDLINVSAGIHEGLELFIRTHPSQYISKGANVHLAEAIRKEVKVPVSTVGAITDPDLMEEILESGKADVIELGRPLLADPFLPRKLREGREREIHKCIRCNACFGESVETGMSSCVVNPVIGNEYNDWVARSQATTPKKVMVVGGGPGGMEAAVTAAERGHEVVLYEKSGSLGGTLRLFKHADFKYPLYELSETLAYKLEKLGVKVVLNADVTKETVEKEAPHTLFIAVGARPVVPRIPGIDSGKVKFAQDIFGNVDKLGENIVVIGAGLVGGETAAYLARSGKKVSLVEMREDIVMDADMFEQAALRVDLRKNNVAIYTSTAAQAINEDGVLVKKADGSEELLAADVVVCAVGYIPKRELFLELANTAPVVNMIGDCRKHGKVTNAMADGYYMALDI